MHERPHIFKGARKYRLAMLARQTSSMRHCEAAEGPSQAALGAAHPSLAEVFTHPTEVFSPARAVTRLSRGAVTALAEGERTGCREPAHTSAQQPLRL
jgi:hypothetical protein